jgi:hypothetical protein
MMIRKNAISLIVTALAIILLISTTIPPAKAVYLSPGSPSSSSLNLDDTITFNNVNLTIRGDERIPVEFLNFTIYEGSTAVAYIKFDVSGLEIEDSPSGRLTVTNITDTSSLPYGSSGSFYGYDENDSSYHAFNYGYGNANGGLPDVTILYQITYQVHQTGSFSAKLFVNSSTYTYISSSSSSFTVSEGTESSSPYPSNESTSVTRPPTNLSAQVNGTNLDVYFYFYNMTPITDTWTQFASWIGISTQRLEFTNLVGNDWIWGNTTYQWSVNISNGTAWFNTTYYYTTGGSRYDVSNNGVVNVQDLSYTWGNRDGALPYDGLYDVNDNGAINVQDLSFIWANRT